ncbi:hypothetical protein [Listeria innocua]|uniref:hypothetical protein n=1 Tax=Listeria innocua TaxID=1642 RepID=UPI001626CA9B|nr:hypothetical protein [Listeria innocua]MBC1925131.1 hypothetical protein [Listeria innocua]
MIILINSFSFKELGLSEKLIHDNDILIISHSRQEPSFPFLSSKTVFLKEMSENTIQEYFVGLNLTGKDVLFIANAEEKIILAGLLNEQYSACKSYFQAMSFIDKYLMRILLNSVIPQPKFKAINSKADVMIYLKEDVGKTHILKPRAQSSANGLYILSSKKNINDLPENLNGYILEEFVDYDIMLTSDGIAYDGQIHTFSVHEYGEKLTESLRKKNYATVSTSRFYNTDKKVIELIYDCTQKVLNKLMVCNYPIPFHLEWFYNITTGELTFCEGAARFGGAEIPKLIECTFDINVKELYWKLLLDNNPTGTRENKRIYEPKYYATTFLSYRVDGVVKRLPEEHSIEWLEKYTCYVKIGEQLKKSNTAVENIFNAVFKYLDYRDIAKGIEKCMHLLKEDVVINEFNSIEEENLCE